MTELTRARAEIDEIDRQMAALFERRMQAAERIAAHKHENGLPVYDPSREQALRARAADLVDEPALLPYYQDLLQRMMYLSRMRQTALYPPVAEHGCIRTWLALPAHPCPIVIGRGLLASAREEFALDDRRVLLVTDDGVPARYVQALAAQCSHPAVCTVPQGEGSKSLAQYEALLHTLQDAGFTRADCVVAVGGGVVCDLAGFAAATYERGLDFYSVPTTLLAQVDAAVGGKTALNLGGVKNVIGVIRQPKKVLIDPDVLQTLPPRQLSCGLAEALKTALIGDPALFDLLASGDLSASLPEIILRALEVKCRFAAQDETDRGVRRLLNFGHTLGHGLEAVTGLPHGECVALGMLPMCSQTVRAKLLPVLKRLGLPTQVSADADAVLAAAQHDKKSRGGAVDAVFVDEIGSARLALTPPDALRERLSVIM